MGSSIWVVQWVKIDKIKFTGYLKIIFSKESVSKFKLGIEFHAPNNMQKISLLTH